MFANIFKRCIHTVKIYKYISDFFSCSASPKVPSSYQPQGNVCKLQQLVSPSLCGSQGSWQSLPYQTSEYCFSPFQMDKQKRAGDKGPLQYHTLQSPWGNNGCQSSRPSTIKSSQALAVNQSSGKITLAERHNWSTLCTTDSASKLNQAKTSRNVSVLCADMYPHYYAPNYML